MTDGLQASNQIRCIQVGELTGGQSGVTAILLANVELEVHVFQLHEDLSRRSLLNRDSSNESLNSSGNDGSDELPQAIVIRLPSRDFSGIWES